MSSVHLEFYSINKKDVWFFIGLIFGIMGTSVSLGLSISNHSIVGIIVSMIMVTFTLLMTLNVCAIIHIFGERTRKLVWNEMTKGKISKDKILTSNELSELFEKVIQTAKQNYTSVQEGKN